MLDDKLRDEIIESQKAQIDLLKWKMILVAAIGAAALGAGSNTPKNAGVLLALIPLLCIYVDSICLHCEIRILTIAMHQRTREEESAERKYERYCKAQRPHFALVTIALLGSSAALSVLVLSAGAFDSVNEVLGICKTTTPAVCGWTNVALIFAGSIGIAATIFFHWFYRRRKKVLDSAD